MYRIALSVVAALGLTLTPVFASQVPADVTAAVNDAGRPDKDKARDADRKPAEIMTLTGVKSGDTVVDVGPGSGYYTRIMSKIVGANGKIYGFNPSWVAEKFPIAVDGVKALAAGGYPNVVNSVQPMAEIRFDQPVDMIFMSQLYHDQVWQKVDVAKMNKAIFAALKPGGVYFIIDHVGKGVTTVEQIDKLHRIDPAVVKEQILAAGFKLATESDLLRNPADTGEKNVFDPALRGHTDQFVYKFVKPN
jgi:predicted methyltransferase